MLLRLQLAGVRSAFNAQLGESRKCRADIGCMSATSFSERGRQDVRHVDLVVEWDASCYVWLHQIAICKVFGEFLKQQHRVASLPKARISPILGAA